MHNKQSEQLAMTPRHTDPTFLEERAASEVLVGKEEVAKVLRRIETAEATKVCYRLIRKYLEPSAQGGITRIEVANKDRTTRIVTEPIEVFN